MVIIMERCQLRFRTLNKRAGAPVDEFIAFLAFVVIAVFTIYFISLIKSSDEKEITGNIAQEKSIDSSQSNLLSFLEYQHRHKQTYDIIIDSYRTEDYSQIEQAARDFFNDIYQDDWILVIKDSKNDVLFSVDSDNSLKVNVVPTDYSLNIVKKAATAYLPLNVNQDVTYLEVELLRRISVKGVIIGQ